MKPQCMMTLFPYLLAGFLLGSIAHAQSVDSDGCWLPSTTCLVGSAKWGTGWSEGNFISYLTNNCGNRVYAKFCNEAPGLSSKGDCGASGIRPGKRNAWSTSKGHNPTGAYAWRFVGSTRPSSDWACSDKVEGWNDPMKFR